MIVPLIAALVSTAIAPPTCAEATLPIVAPADSTLAALYASGVDYARFLADATSRREQWLANSAKAVVPADALAAARALPGRWRLLVIAVDGCSDSVNTIPYLARLVEEVPSIELRIVLPDPGKAVMETHRTPDGRAATPTVVVLDESGADVGCWVERPSVLQSGAIDARAKHAMEDWARGKQAWYDADSGASTIREVVAVLQAAAAGTPRCGSGPLPQDKPGQ